MIRAPGASARAQRPTSDGVELFLGTTAWIYDHVDVGLGQPKSLTQCRRFFLEAQTPRQRAYEVLRAYFVEGRPSHEVARAFGYSPGAFRVMCHQFRRERAP